MHAKKMIIMVAALFLVTAYAPAAVATHDFVVRGDMGPDNVRHEPNNYPEANGMPAKVTPDDYYVAEDTTLLLESFLASGTYPRYLDNTQIMNQALGNKPGEYTYVIVPGMSQFTAFWGWWTDVDGDGIIDDEYDADVESDSPPVDEFVMRGQSNRLQANYNATLGTWAEQHGHFYTLRDTMFAFISPGTWDDQFDQTENGKLIRPTADPADVPDIQFDDRSYQDSGTGFTGWLGEGGWNAIAYDQSLFMVTEVISSVNPVRNADGSYNPTPSDATVGKRDTWHDEANSSKERAYNIDKYSSFSPLLEDAYRIAVWDPGNKQASPGDEVDNEGPKQAVKDAFEPQWQFFWLQYGIINAEVNELTAPFVGPVDDLVSPPRALEPNHPDDTHPGVNATVTSALEYGGTPYFKGTPAMWQAYQDNETAWIDILPYYGCPDSYGIQVRSWCGDNYFPLPAESGLDNAADGGLLPGLLWLDGNIGTWYDYNGDGFIGNLSEAGRSTSADNPYASGTIDDPNDYSDIDWYHNLEVQPAKKERDDQAGENTAEWQGSSCGGSITAEVRPATSWGTVGVYHVEDADGAYFNPYDDILGDAIGYDGHEVTPQDPDGNVPQFSVVNDDGNQLNRRYTGTEAIPISFTCEGQAPGNPGWFHGDDMILFPTGTLTTDVIITSTGVIGPDHTARSTAPNNDVDLGGTTIVDVDYVPKSI